VGNKRLEDFMGGGLVPTKHYTTIEGYIDLCMASGMTREQAEEALGKLAKEQGFSINEERSTDNMAKQIMDAEDQRFKDAAEKALK